MTDFDIAALTAERDRLLGKAKTVLMAASGEGGVPEMGVTPVVRHEGHF